MSVTTILITSAIFRTGIYLMLVWFAWMHRCWKVASLALLFITTIAGINLHLTTMYIISSNLGAPLVAWVLIKAMRQGKIT